MTALFTYKTKSNVDVRNDILRSIKNGLSTLGITNANVGPNSDYYLTASALGTEVAVGLANITISVDNNMPDTAAGANLDRWLNILSLSRRPAIGSSGVVVFTCSVASTLVTVGMVLLDTVGLRYQVTVGGSYANGALIPVSSIDLGKATNHANGDPLTWLSGPAFSAPTVSVGTSGGSDGLSGGFDSEVGIDDPPRARLLAQMQNPPKGGNSADVILWCTQSTPIVQSAYCYPALLGPGTTFAAVAAQPQTAAPMTATSKSRQITPTSILTGTIQPFVQGQLPEHVFSVIASVVDQPTDVAILLALPSAPTASPPGLGGGWLDGSPWPASTGGTTPVSLTAAASSTVFTVTATTTPQVGVSHIAWLSPLNWTLYTATVIAFSGTTGAYVITVDTPMPGIAAGHYIWPQAAQMQTYVNALLTAFSLMGPGEWTANAAVKARSFRHPIPSQSWPYALTAVQLKTITNSGPEVLDANWIYRSATLIGGLYQPTIPGTVTVDTTTGNLTSAAVNILTPRNLAFYAA